MKKPIIGVASLFDIELQSMWMFSGYFEAIEESGGIPVMLSIQNRQHETDQLLDVLDGVLLPGGHDVCPLSYGENITAFCGPTVPKMDEAEMILAKGAFERKIPLLGLCKGSQLINVAMGGTLYQDIQEYVERSVPLLHIQKDIVPKAYPSHSVRISKDSCLYDCYRCETINVNSFHHQASKAIAPTLFAAAHAEDGVVEAVECISRDQFFLGVQWHPELMFRYHEDARKLFRYFIHCATSKK